MACVAGVLGLCAYAAVAIWYASDLHFFDNAEPTITALGWLFHAGQPLYPAPDAAEQYAHIYGPMAYILHGVVLAALGPGIGVSKGLGAGAGMASLALLYAAIRPHGSAMRAASLTGVCALLLLMFRNYSFWTRPDPLQLLCISAALLLAASERACGRGHWRAVFVGLASGVLWNLKFTGPMYSLPVFALLRRRSGVRETALAAAVGIVAAAAPFVVFPNVSLADYLTWVRLSARTGLSLSVLRQNLEWAAYFGLPLLLSYYAVPREKRPSGPEWRDVMVALSVGICGVVIAAAKPGAGPYHLLPFLPIIVFVVSWQLSGFSLPAGPDPVAARGAVAFLLVTVLVAIAQQAQLITTIRARSTLLEADDIRQFAGSHPGTIEMGYGRTETLTLARPVLVFRNNSYLLDQPAVREHQLEGFEVSRATIDALLACRVNYWLIPRGEAPFSGVNSYAAVLLRPLYPLGFRRAFEATYKRVGTTAYYDVWQCRTRPGT